mmetsp:Transcript_70830/g.229688  ORF Transcript_70830/g.229688 Transcript_70830/m.229688 type:complete len:222 (+) Transcript_70830:429-1094(+)
MPGCRGEGNPGSKYIDWDPNKKNPAIKQEEMKEAMERLARAPADDNDGNFRKADSYRFFGSNAFERFIDRLLLDGDIVLRAAYAPANENFCGRASGVKCKVMASSLPTLVYDDHAEDWEVFSWHKVVTAVTPGNAAKNGTIATDFIDELNCFYREFFNEETAEIPCGRRMSSGMEALKSTGAMHETFPRRCPSERLAEALLDDGMMMGMRSSLSDVRAGSK